VPTEPELLRLLDRSPIGMYRSDAHGRLLLVNPAMVAMLGYDSVEEVLALDLNRDIYADPAGRQPVLEDYRLTGFVEGRRVEWKTRTGRILTVQLHGHVTETAQGLVFDATAIDLTEIDRLESELRREREEREKVATILDQVMRQMPALYWVVDNDLRILHGGGASEGITGYAAGTFRGATIQDVADADPMNVDTIANHHRALAGEIVKVEAEYRGKHLATVIGPYRCGGKIVGAIGTSIDVTPWRTLERRMVDAQRAESLGLLAGGLAHDFNNLLVAVIGYADLALRELAEGKSARAAVENIQLGDVGRAFDDMADRTAAIISSQRQLMADVSHELRTPLARIRVALELAAEDPVAAKDVLADVGHDLDEIDKLIEDILTTARLDVGPSALQREPISVGELADRAAARFHARYPARTLDKSVVDAERAVECDPVLLRRALDNLLDNAAKYSEASAPVTLAAKPNGTRVAFEIVDRGIGMTADELARAGTPFWRADTSRARRTGGVGLGLALARRIARAHGGDVSLDSAPGRGTTARLAIPLPAPQTEADGFTPAAEPHVEADGFAPAAKKAPS
jgi:PAS domain S-box-containing protein